MGMFLRDPIFKKNGIIRNVPVIQDVSFFALIA